MYLRELKDALHAGNRESLFSELIHRKQEIMQDSRFSQTMGEVKEFVEQWLEQPDGVMSFSQLNSFFETGSRDIYTNNFLNRRKALCALGFLCIFDGEKRYISALEDLIWSHCNEYSWAEPAHLAESFEKADRMTDLTACELAEALAELTFLLKEKLNPKVTKRAKQMIRERVLQPIVQMRGLFNWEKGITNWTAVCGGCAGIAAIYLIEDEEQLAVFLKMVLDALEQYPKSFQPDGACAEGLGYWSYGLSNYLAFSEILKQRTGGAVDLMKAEGMEDIACFMGRCRLTENHVVNFSDCNIELYYVEGFVHKLKELFPRAEVAPSQYALSFKENILGRWCGFIRDVAWRREEYRSASLLQDSCHVFEHSQWLNARRVVDGNTICFAAKGGNNGESHNHNDIGTFIYQINGSPLLIDMGPGKYTQDYFGDKRYESIYTNSFGHSVPILDGMGQETGEEYAADFFRAQTHDEIIKLQIGLSGAYKGEGCLVRDFAFDSDGTLEITDTYEAQTLLERFVVASVCEPSVYEDCVIITGKDACAVLRFDSEQIECCEITRAEGYFSLEKFHKYFVDFHIRPGTKVQFFISKTDKEKQ